MAESANDEFGVRKIYPSNIHPNRPKPWHLGKGNWDARLFNTLPGDWLDCPTSTDSNGDLVINFNTSDDEGYGRFPVLADLYWNYPISSGTVTRPVSESNQKKLRKRGYMGKVNDWKNLEVTVYWRAYSTITKSHIFNLCARGGPHHYEPVPVFGGDTCEGTCYLAGMSVEGQGGIGKELGHPHYAENTDETLTGLGIADPMRGWVGMKGIFYTRINGNPKIELWISKNGNNEWGENAVLEYEDRGGWFLTDDPDHDGYREIDVFGIIIRLYGNACEGKTDEQITWGGPGVIFKISGIPIVDMKWASVREIIPRDGFSLKLFLNSKGFAPPVSLRSVAEHYGITGPISVNELIQTVLW